MYFNYRGDFLLHFPPVNVTNNKRDKKLSCRRETVRCFLSLNISLSHSRSLKVIPTGTIRKLGYDFLFAFHSNYGSILYHFRDKARYWSKIAVFYTFVQLTPSLGGR